MKEVHFTCVSCREAISATKDDIGELIQCPSCGNAMKVPVYGVIPGMKLGDFTIDKLLGVGGMGEVWLARQESLHRKVAIKILAPEIANDRNFVQRFLQEAKIAGKLTHPNIVMAYHAGEQDGILYLAISFVDGKPLGDMVANGQKLPEHEALRIIREIAKALKYAWDKFKILHRDIKPDNIMIAHDGTPMLMDMGISKITDTDESLTLTGTIVGTPYYISPEQARAEANLDFRSDQYSLGATLFHLVTGQLPYHATSAMGILAQHLQDPVPDCKKINKSISNECNALIKKLMAKSPADRFQSWNEIINTIDQLLPLEMRDSTPLPGTVHALTGKKSKVPGYIIVALVLVLLMAIFSLNKKLKQAKEKNRDLETLQELTDSSLTAIDKEIDKPDKTKPETKPQSFQPTVQQLSINKPEKLRSSPDGKKDRSPEADPEEKMRNHLKAKLQLNDADTEKLVRIIKQYKKELKDKFSKNTDTGPGVRLRKMNEVRQLQMQTTKRAEPILKTFEKIKEFRIFLAEETMKFHKKHFEEL